MLYFKMQHIQHMQPLKGIELGHLATTSFLVFYILIGEGVSFQLHNFLIFGRIFTFEVSNSRYFHVDVI
jgi:hypothetical protein